jgi:hypothetical protein
MVTRIIFFLLFNLLFCPLQAETTIQKILETSKQKNFQLALSLLDEWETDHRQKRNNIRATIYHTWSLDACDDKNYLFALDLSRKSQIYEPNHKVILWHQGNLHYLLKQWFEAILALEKCRDRLDESKQLQAGMLIAKSYSKMGNLSAALSELRNLFYNNNHNEELLILLIQTLMKNQDYDSASDYIREWKSSHNTISPVLEELEGQIKGSKHVQLNYQEGQSAHFNLIMNPEEMEYRSGDILDILDGAYGKITNEMNFFPRNFITVKFLSKKDFRNITKVGSYILGIHSGSTEEIFLPLDRIKKINTGKQLANTLYHELTHYMAFNATASNGTVPLWFHEGIAKWMEPYPELNEFETTLKAIGKENAFYDENTIPSQFNGFLSWKGYVQSWSVIDYLSKQDVLDPLLSNLKTLGPGDSFDSLVKLTTGKSLKRWLKEWNLHMKETYQPKGKGTQ